MVQYLNKERLVLVSLISLDFDNALGFGLECKVSPQRLLKARSIASKLVSILLGQLTDSEGPAIMGAGKGNIAQLRLKVVFLVFQINLILLMPGQAWKTVWTDLVIQHVHNIASHAMTEQ